MEVKYNHTRTSFGWHYKMHSDIVQNSIKHINLDDNVINTIKKYVQMPDFDEFFLFGQKHFFYPNDTVKSYLDYTGKHNAKSMYNLHLKKMLQLFNNGEHTKGLERAGRALHYLQDMTQPNHIDSGSILKKAFEKEFPHHKFEMDSFSKGNKIFHNIKHIEFQSRTFEELFDEVIKLSQKNKIPTRSNTGEWDTIAQDAMNIATSATEKFMELLRVCRYYS